MEELQRLQSERLKRLLAEQGITQKELAKKLGASATSVNHWVHGKVHMNDYNASLIHELYPDYSAEWLRGYSNYPNDKEERLERRSEQWRKSFLLIDCFDGLMKLNGVEFELVETTKLDENGEPYDFGGYVVVSKDEKSLSVSAEQWDALQKEVLGYVGFRIDQLLERGCW